MTSKYLPTDLVSRLGKICGLLGSDHDGESSAAAFQATKLLRSAGWTWAELVEAAGPRNSENAREFYRSRHASDYYDPAPPRRETKFSDSKPKPASRKNWRQQRKDVFHFYSDKLSEAELMFLLGIRPYAKGPGPTERQRERIWRIYSKVTA